MCRESIGLITYNPGLFFQCEPHLTTQVQHGHSQASTRPTHLHRTHTDPGALDRVNFGFDGKFLLTFPPGCIQTLTHKMSKSLSNRGQCGTSFGTTLERWFFSYRTHLFPWTPCSYCRGKKIIFLSTLTCS